MKTSFRVLGLIFTLGLVILVSLHLIMLRGLTKALRDVVLPRVKQETGIDVKVGRLSMNLANGFLFLNDVEVRNPEGFLLENLASVERVNVAVDIPSLFKQKLIHVTEIEVENVLVNVIRNKAGEINLNKLQEGLPQPTQPPAESLSDKKMPPAGQVPPVQEPSVEQESKPLPEILIDSLQGNATLRYVDFKLNELDIALDLSVKGQAISTQRAPDTPWGDIGIAGSLGDKRASFVTDLNLKLAPVTDPQKPSFDLTGKILEIDPTIMDRIYDSLNIRSAPFGLDPEFHCRAGQFENSLIALNFRDIELETGLANSLGGIGSIGSLRFVVPVEGSLQKPRIDIQTALMSAIGGNSRSVLSALLKGAAEKQAGMDQSPAKISDAAVEILGQHVGEIGKSETAKKILKDLVGGKESDTNAPPAVSSDSLIDILGEQVDEIGENEALKDELKNLGKRLFGK